MKYHLNYNNNVENMLGRVIERDGVLLEVTEQFYDVNTNKTRITLEPREENAGS